jgi:hypothetical protein
MGNYKNSFWIAGLLIVLLTVGFSIDVFAQEAISGIEAEISGERQTDTKKKEDTQVRVPQQISSSNQKISSNDLIAATTYAFSTQNGVALEDMSSGTTTVIAADTDDSNSLLQNIGFDFWYDGVRFTTFGVNGNGFAKLGSVITATGFFNDLDTTTEAPKIAVLWDDLCVGTAGSVRYKTIGSAPNRKLIVEWNNMKISRNGNCTFPNPNNGTFQLWLFESASSTKPGVIQMVYGAIPATAVADTGYSVGLQSGVATNFAAVTTSTDTVSYAAGNDAQTNAIPAGKSYLFTPNIPFAPFSLNFTAITPTSQTLNWTDNSANEVGFVIYRSTDNVNFTFVGQTAANATTFNDTGLAPATNYFYRVFAVTEGALNDPVLALTGSQMTLAGVAKSCVGAGGDWNNPAIWSPAGIPTAADNVTIISGCVVNVNVTDAVALNVTINAGGTLQSPTTGAVITNNLTVGGNVINNGVLDFSTNGDTSAAILTFGAGGFDVALSGNGVMTDVRDITVAKGAIGTVVDVTVTNFTVRGVNTDVAGYLTLTSGTFKVSGTFTLTNRTFLVAAYVIPATGGFWLNNPNYTIVGQNGSPTNNGLLRQTQGIFNVGTSSGNTMGAGNNAQFTIEGGTMNIAGRLQSTATGLVYTQTGGALNVSTVGNGATTASFGLTSATNTFNWAGGTITLVVPNSNLTPLDWSVSTASILVTNPAVTTLNVGTGATAEIFRVAGNTPNITIPTNKTMNVGSGTGAAIFFRGSSFTNNGVVGTQGTGSRFDWAASGAMSYAGIGTFGTAGTPFGGVGMSANSPTGSNTAINAPIVLFRVNVFSGGFTNSGSITFGNGGVSTTVIQLGNSTTATNAGTFDVSPIFMLGSGGHILLYLRTTGATRNTGFEIPPGRSVVTYTYDNAVPGHTLVLTGGPLTITGAMTLTNGIFVTSQTDYLTHNGAATRTGTCAINTCFIDGPMRREYTAIGSYTFHVGENEYSPVLINVTATSLADGAALGFPYLFVEAFDATLAGMNPPTSISRNWAITEVGNLTADLSFTYAESDTPNTGADTDETDYRVWRREGTGNTQTFTNLCPGGPCVNVATNVAGPVLGVTQFSRWTVADNQVPVAASVNVGGRVSTFDGITGLPKVKVTLTGSTLTEPRVIMTNPFGYYMFQDLPVGMYVLQVDSKQYTFSVPTRVITAEDNIINADFTANP